MAISFKKRIVAASSLVVVFLLLAGVYEARYAAPVAPTLNEALYVSDSSLILRLMPADVDSKTHKPLYPVDSIFDRFDGGKHIGSFVLNKDGSSQDIYFQGDGEKLSYLKDYYARVPGEPGRRQKSLVNFAPDGETVQNEAWYRFDGSQERVGHLLQDGLYQLFTMFDDGYTASSELVTRPDMSSTGLVPKLVKEQHWRPQSAGHTLSSLNILNDDGTREFSQFDAKGRLLIAQHNGLWGTSGTTVKGFYPETGRLRLDSTTDYQATDANYFRVDGTLERKLTLSSYSVTVTFYDAAGKIPLFKQTFWIRSKLDHGVSTDYYVLWQIDELHADGKIARSLTFDEHDKMTQETVFGDTVNGVAFDRRQLYYRQDGTLEKEEAHEPGADYKTTLHTAAENIRAVYPASEQVMFVMTDKLPIPPPERNEH